MERCVKLYFRVIFFILFFFDYVNAHTANTEKRGFSSMHPKRVLVVDAFHWGHFAQGIKSFLFYPQSHFHWAN